MELISNLDSWGYLALAMVVVAIIMLGGGINALQKANPELVDAKRLRLQALGALVLGVAYIFAASQAGK